MSEEMFAQVIALLRDAGQAGAPMVWAALIWLILDSMTPVLIVGIIATAVFKTVKSLSQRAGVSGFLRTVCTPRGIAIYCNDGVPSNDLLKLCKFIEKHHEAIRATPLGEDLGF